MSYLNYQIDENNQSAHEDVYVTALSNNADKIDFKYVFDVYANNRILMRAKIFPNPDDNYGYFNIRNIVGNEMKFNWFNPGAGPLIHELNDSGEMTLPVLIKFGEELSGVTSLNLNEDAVTLYNNYPKLYSKHRIQIDQTRFLTDRTRESKIKVGGNFFIGVRTDAGKIRIRYYATGDVLVNEFETTLYKDLTGYFQYNFSMESCEILRGSVTSATNVDVYDNNVLYYTVELMDIDDYTKEWTTRDMLKLIKTCNGEYDTFNLHFMNRYGLYDTAIFDKASKLTLDIERKFYERNDGKYMQSKVRPYNFYEDFGKNVYQYNESKINFNNKINYSYKLTMDYPDDRNYDWLDELICSPSILFEVTLSKVKRKPSYEGAREDRYEINNFPTNDVEYYPVNVKNNNYEYSLYVNNKLKAFEIDIEFNQIRHGFKR